VDEKYEDTKIMITCGKLTPELEKIISLIRIFDMQLTGKKDGELFILDVSDVLYADTVDKKTFLYTGNDVYESGLKLYELEEQLAQVDFVRVSKSALINMRHIISLKADFDRRIKATMSNREQLMISRQYADFVKTKLGVK